MNTIEIQLTKEKKAMVSNEDKDINNKNWFAVEKTYSNGRKTFYVGRRISMKNDGMTTKGTIYLHDEILKRMGINKQHGQEIDHINGNPLDNRRENLRVVTSQQNKTNCNARRTFGTRRTSKYKGVGWKKDHNKWIAQICANRKTTHLGYFQTEEEAARRYDEEAETGFGKYAKLNFR